jgi:hypothetical protein
MKATMTLALGALCTGLALAAADNLLQNGDFSQVDNQGGPSGWKLTPSAILEMEKPNRFVRIYLKQLGDYSAVSQDVPVKPDWETLRLGLRLRVQALTDHPARKPGEVPRAMLVFQDAEGKKQFRPVCHLADPTGGQWVERWEDIKILPDTISVGVVADLSGVTGNFDVDDVQLLADAPKGMPLSALATDGAFSFRRLNRVASPPGWIVPYAIATAEKPPLRIEREGDNGFVRIENNAVGKSVTMEQFYALDPAWKKVKISARMRAKGLSCGAEVWEDARVMVTFADNRGQKVGGYGEVPCVKADQDWQEMSAVREIPEGATAIRLQVGLFSSTGTVDFDDIRVEPVR